MSVYAFTSLLSFLLSLAAGIVVYTQSPRSMLNRMFLALSLCFSGWALVEYGYRTTEQYEIALFWNQMNFFWIIAAPITLHMVLLFTEHQRLLTDWRAHALLYGPAVVFIGLHLCTGLITGPPEQQYWGWTFTLPEKQLVWSLSILWTVVLAIITVFLLMRYVTGVPRHRRQGAMLLTSGFLFTFISAQITESVLPYFGFQVPGISVESYSIGVMLAGAAVWRYQIFRVHPEILAGSIIEAMEDGLLVVNPALRIVRTNTAADRLFRRPPQTLSGMHLGDLIRVEPTSPLYDAVESGRLLAGLADVEADAVLDDGRICPVSISTGGIPKERGYICLVRDITERRLAHRDLNEMKQHLEELVAERTKELVRSHQRFQEIVDLLPQIVYEIDLNGIITYANRQTFSITGYNEEDYEQGFHAVELLAPKDHERAKKNMQQVLGGKQLGVNEYTAVRKDGTRFPVLTKSAPIIRDGRVIGMRGVFFDITDRKKIENELLNYERRFRDVLENVNMLAGMVKSDDTIEFVNDYLLKVTGWTRGELIGKKIGDVLLPPELRDSFNGIFARRDCPVHQENEILTASGERRLVAWNNTVMLDTDGNVLGVNSIGEDITEKRALEHQFLQAQKMETVGRLAGGIAHDFNNLLTIIMGNAEIGLLTTKTDESAYEHLSEIKQTASRATDLIRQLLAFSRRQVTELKPVNINRVLLDMDKMLRRLIGADIELVALPGDPLDMVRIDPGNFEQVITNLAINARDAMPDGGTMTIATENATFTERIVTSERDLSPGKYVVIRVTDTGAGMESEIIPHLFEPFFSTKEPGKGTGLGLATSYSIVTRLGGSIDVEHTSGQGTCMRIILPRYEGNTAPAPVRSLTTEEAPSGTETILLAEDEPSLNRLLVCSLDKLGYRVFTAANGEEALRIASEQGWDTLDLILTDVVMPRMSGNELVNRAREHRPDLPVLYMSGYTDNAAVSKHILKNHCDFIQKPFTPTRMGLMVRAMLDGDSASSGTGSPADKHRSSP